MAGDEHDPREYFLPPLVGGLSGLFADVATHPMSTVKTRLQVQGATKIAQVSPLRCARQMLAAEGPGSFFQGVGAVCGGAPFASALYFSGIESCKTVAGTGDAAMFAAGFGGQLCGSLAWVPMDVVKERLQIEGSATSTESYGSSLRCLRGIVGKEGYFGLCESQPPRVGLCSLQLQLSTQLHTVSLTRR